MNEHLPTDRGGIETEQRNPRSQRLHAMSVAECVALMQAEDARVIDAVREAHPAICAFIAACEERFVGFGGRLVYLGAGTSGRLGVLDASEIPPTFQMPAGRVVGIIAGGDSSLRKSSEGREDEPRGAWEELERLGLSERDTVLGIAAGGTTKYVLGGLEFAKTRVPGGCLTGFLACADVRNVPHADHVIAVRTGPEVLTGSTRLKAGTATKLVLNTISTTLMVRLGRVYENLMVDVRASNEKLRDRAARIVAELTGLDRGASLALVDEAGGVVKTAVVMHRRGLGREEAERVLAAKSGRLDAALGEPIQSPRA